MAITTVQRKLWGMVPEQEHETKALFVKGRCGQWLEAFSVNRQEYVRDKDGNPEDRHMAASTDLRKPLSAITWGKEGYSYHSLDYCWGFSLWPCPGGKTNPKPIMWPMSILSPQEDEARAWAQVTPPRFNWLHYLLCELVPRTWPPYPMPVSSSVKWRQW